MIGRAHLALIALFEHLKQMTMQIDPLFGFPTVERAVQGPACDIGANFRLVGEKP